MKRERKAQAHCKIEIKEDLLVSFSGGSGHLESRASLSSLATASVREKKVIKNKPFKG